MREKEIMSKLKKIDVKNKKVLVRVDFNVPFVDGQISDINRIKQALPTIEYLVTQGAKIILFSHLGKVKVEADKVGKSLEPVAKKLSELLGQDVIFINETRGQLLEMKVATLQPGQILMVENTRFEDINDRAESTNNLELATY